MKITYKRKSCTFEPSKDNISVYNVPSDYSKDTYYIAEWNKFEVEPIPASAQEQTTLLLTLEKDDDTYIEHYKLNGVKYA